MEKKTHRLNEAAQTIAKEMDSFKPPIVMVAEGMATLSILREQIKEELKKQSEVIRKIAEDGNKKVMAERNKLANAVEKAEKKQEDIIMRMREAQPELQEIEFQFNAEEGTYTKISERTKEEEKEDEVNKEISNMVNALIKKWGVK